MAIISGVARIEICGGVTGISVHPGIIGSDVIRKSTIYDNPDIIYSYNTLTRAWRHGDADAGVTIQRKQLRVLIQDKIILILI